MNYEFKGTPAGWRVESFIGGNTEIMYGTDIIATMVKNKGKLFNAKLISKAPEMFEEIKHLVRALKTVSSFGATQPIIEHAEQLLKEATEL